jgi:MFS family permease
MSSATRQINSTGTDTPYPNPAYAWYVVTVLFLAYVVSFLDRQILALLVEPIKQDLQISDTTISLLHGFTFAIFYTIFGFPLGRLADRRNRTRLIVVGVALWSLMTAFCGFARNALILFSARIGVAVGEATLSPSAYSLISDYFPRSKRGRAISLYSLGIFTGAGIAYIFGGLVAEFARHSVSGVHPWLSQFKPWQLTFILTGSLGIPVLALLMTVREPARKERLGNHQGSIPLAAIVAYLRQYWRVYFALLVGSGFIALANYSLFAWIPAYFIRVYDYTPRTIGTTFGTIILVFGTAGLVVGGLIADLRFRRGHIASHLDTTIVMTALGLIPAMLMASDLGEQMQLTFISAMVFAGAVSTGLVPAALQLITPNELRGQITAVYLLLTSLIGLGMGPTAVALLTDYYFEDPLSIGASLAITVSVSLFIGIVLMQSGRSAYLQRQRQFLVRQRE